jgi:hypothetical protein
VEAPGNPRSVRFLHVLQGADSADTADPAVLLQSTDGTRFTGAAVAGTAVVFPDELHPDFANTTLAVPAGVTRLLVTGLAPDTGYRTGRDGDRITVSTGGPTTTDHGGVLVVDV